MRKKKIEEVIIQTRPEGADQWDPGVTMVLKGCTREEGIEYILDKAKKMGKEFRKQKEKDGESIDDVDLDKLRSCLREDIYDLLKKEEEKENHIDDLGEHV